VGEAISFNPEGVEELPDHLNNARLERTEVEAEKAPITSPAFHICIINIPLLRHPHMALPNKQLHINNIYYSIYSSLFIIAFQLIEARMPEDHRKKPLPAPPVYMDHKVKQSMQTTPTPQREVVNTLISSYESLAKNGQLDRMNKTDILILIAHFREEDSWSEALRLSEEALAIHRMDKELLTHQIEILLEYKRPGEAMEQLAVLEQAGGDEITCTCLRIKAMTQMDEVEMARVLLPELKYRAPQNRMTEIHLLEAQVHARSGDQDAAYHSYKEVLRIEPRHRTALERIWLASESSRNQKDSLQFHQELIDQDPYNGMAWFNAGQAYYYLLRYEEAMEAFEYAGLLEPHFKLTFCYAAEVALAIGDPKRALKSLYDIQQRIQPDGEILKQIAQAYQALENPAKARQYFLLARNLTPLDDEIYYQLGKIYMLEKKPSIAARYFERAVNLDDRNEDYMTGLAEAWLAEGKPAEAEACYVRATELAPELPESWSRYAQFKYNQEAYAEVIALLDEAVEHTWGASLYFIRAAAEFRLNQRKQALRSLEEALSEDMDEQEVLFTCAPELRNDKDVKAILRYFALEHAGY